MCYSIYLSISSNQDLTQFDSELCRFEKWMDPDDEEIVACLHHSNRWFVTRYGSCSCHFRHLIRHPDIPDFSAPEDWMNEDADDVESTAAFYDVLHQLIRTGNGVDIISVWSDTKAEEVEQVQVDLYSVPREAFRFLEDVQLVHSRASG